MYPYRMSYYFENLKDVFVHLYKKDYVEAKHDWYEFTDLFIHPFRLVKYGIENFWQWKGIIWNDRNWDYYFIYVILKKKLELMEHNIRNYSHHLYADDDAQEIKDCINILDRLIEDDYSSKYPDWEQEEQRRQSDIDFLFDILKDKHRGWWD